MRSKQIQFDPVKSWNKPFAFRGKSIPLWKIFQLRQIIPGIKINLILILKLFYKSRYVPTRFGRKTQLDVQVRIETSKHFHQLFSEQSEFPEFWHQLFPKILKLS